MMRLEFNGAEYNFWENLSVEASINDAQRTFTATVSPESLGGLNPTAAVVLPGSTARVFSDGSLLLDGFVNKYSPEFSPTSHSITISGRSGSQDSVDTSALHPTGRFENMDAVEIANQLAGVVNNTYTSKDTLPKIPVFQINQGEKVHQVARRLASIYGYSLMGTEGGEIQFVRAGEDIIGEISEGVAPLIEASSELSDVNLYSSFEYKGQLSSYEDKYEAEAAHNISEITDSRSTRFRPFVQIVDKSTDTATAMERARWQAMRKSGDAAKVSAVISGHRLNGNLVVPNVNVFVNSVWLLISNQMLIDKVTWSASATDKTQASFSMVPPEAYAGAASASSGTGDARREDGVTAAPLPNYRGTTPVPQVRPSGASLSNPPSVA